MGEPMKKLAPMTVATITMVFSTLSILGCSKHPPPDEAAAQGSAPLEQGKVRRQPPAELYAACDGKKNGDECTAKRGDHEFKGQCINRPESGQDQRLFCRPSRPAQQAQ